MVICDRHIGDHIHKYLPTNMVGLDLHRNYMGYAGTTIFVLGSVGTIDFNAIRMDGYIYVYTD